MAYLMRALQALCNDRGWRIGASLLCAFCLYAAIAGLKMVPLGPVGGAVVGFDGAIAEAVHQHRSETVALAFLVLTVLGNASVAGAVAASILAVMALRARSLIIPFAFSIAGTVLTVGATKLLVARPRPGEEFAYYLMDTYSFPSGHAALGIALYGFIAYALSRRMRSVHARRALVGLGLVLGALIAASRVYLGVHFVSDIIGGMLIGGVWLLLGTELYENVFDRRRLKSAAA